MEDQNAKKRKIDDEASPAVDVQGPPEAPEKQEADDLPLPSERKESVTLMLSTMSINDLRELLIKTATDIDDVYRAILAKAGSDPASRKLFIRGLAFSTTIETVKEYFSQFGEIEEGTVVTNKQSGQSRGYGFVTYKEISAAHKAVKDPKKFIDDREVTCNLAAAGNNGHTGSANTGGSGGLSQPNRTGSSGGGGGGSDDVSLRKLFVRGLSWDTTSETLLHFFGQFGVIAEGGIVTDRTTQKSKGYGFVTFQTVEAAREALKQPSKYLDGRTVHVNLAEEGKRGKDQAAPQSGGNNWSAPAGYGAQQPQQQQWSGAQWGAPPAQYPAYPMGAYAGYGAVQAGYSGYTAPGGYNPAGYGAQPAAAPPAAGAPPPPPPAAGHR